MGLPERASVMGAWAATSASGTAPRPTMCLLLITWLPARPERATFAAAAPANLTTTGYRPPTIFLPPGVHPKQTAWAGPGSRGEGWETSPRAQGGKLSLTLGQ